MIRFDRVVTEAPSAGELPRALRLTLAWDDRTRSRLVLMRDGGAIAVQLPRGTVLRDGTVLRAATGEVAVVEAAPQPLLKIAAEPALLLRIVYHLANRHVAVQLAADHVLIEADPVLAAMARQLGARVEAVEAPFEPEAGAYHADGHHGHGDADDAASASLGEQLSIEAHRRRSAGG